MTAPEMPTDKDLLWPTLEVLKNNGGSASIQELSEQVTRLLALPDEVADALHGEGPQTEVGYRLAWARTNLKWVGAVDNTARGVWRITPKGRAMPSDEELRDLVRRERKRRWRERVKPATAGRSKDPESSTESDWEEDLLVILRELTPAAFERLCQRILRESGFTKVEVTGRSGDGGIDGAGVLRVNLISFHVRFQCKRYAGSVQAREIRDFRGAMVGRADKGLFMTTGRFTSGAVREAVRDGAPAIDLIDGLALCGLLRKLELGVSTELVKRTRPQPEFFAEI
ncbi:restriction endonuclease [Candidatus Palauibacter sp.]|uniref:restriction endonuclease n=1 Tax=Candidatus Palauibacter sp. TaxID=3101350 RepID=UPI003B523280